MGRRLQDPLAELVKIDPKAVGVGQYQHDMNQKKLDEALGGVVEDCVNHVGVDLNTASFSLLSYVSGISGALAKNIVAYREANGRFQSRRELLKVAKLGPKAFEQCAGFLRIRDGKEPLDATAVHPEDYAAVEQKLKGTVRNIVDFGAFVDIGVHQDGLVHISRMTKRFIKHPLEAVHVGDVVDVTVLSVDVGKKRIALSMVE